MSWSNKAIETFEKAGYEIHLKFSVNVIGGYEVLGYRPNLYVGKALGKEERVKEDLNEIVKVSPDQPIILTTSLLDSPTDARSGGTFSIFPDNSFYYKSATGEAIKLLRSAGYSHRREKETEQQTS